MHLPNNSVAHPTGVAFDIPDLLMLRAWADYHELRLAIELDVSGAKLASFKRACQYSTGKSSLGAKAGVGVVLRVRAAAIFSICLTLGMRQPAGRSVMRH